MANMLDYLDWRGDLTLRADPWNDVDSLMLACLCYLDMPQAAETPVPLRKLVTESQSCDPTRGPASSFFTSCQALACQCAGSVRMADIMLRDYVNEVDPAREIQFSAVTADLPDGRCYVAFRGTDSSLVGWREDFSLSFETVPAQTAATAYLENAAKAGRRLILGGHSKGGHLSLYAAAHASPATQALIDWVYTFDGPGLDDVTFASAGYANIRDRVRSFIPQSSIVGLLLTHHEDYTVVHSNAVSILQHDAFTWQLVGKRFVEMEQVDKASQVVDQTVHQWLRQLSPDDRRLFVNTLFDLLESGKATELSFKDLAGDLPAILGATRRLSHSTVLTMAQMLGRLLKIGAANVRGALQPKLPETTPKEES